jgi:hypothetical protein
MSESLLDKLRKIVSLARELETIRENALRKIASSNALDVIWKPRLDRLRNLAMAKNSQDRVDAIAALAVQQDAMQMLRVLFDSLDIQGISFDDLSKQTDDDLLRAIAENPGKSVHAMHEQVLGGAATLEEVRKGLDNIFHSRLRQVLGRLSLAEFLGSWQPAAQHTHRLGEWASPSRKD